MAIIENSPVVSDSESDTIFSISEDLVQSPNHKQASTNLVDFDGLLQPPLKLHEDLANGCGGQLWPAGMRLAKYLLLRKRDELKDCSIVELGAGGGLVGLAVAIGCDLRQSLHITDQEVMLELMQTNIKLNGLEAKVTASIFDWGEPKPRGIPDPDIILAADCVYFEPAFKPLQQTLQELIGENTVCYFCFKKRRRADLHFMKAIRKEFLVEEVADDPDSARYARENVSLYKIARRPSYAATRN